MEEFGRQVLSIITTAGSKILLAVLVYLVGRWIITKIVEACEKIKGFQSLEYLYERLLEYVLHIRAVHHITGADRSKIPDVALIKQTHPRRVPAADKLQKLKFTQVILSS